MQINQTKTEVKLNNEATKNSDHRPLRLDLRPNEIVAMLRDSESSQSIALQIIRACLSVSCVYEISNAGSLTVKKTKRRIYSLPHARRLARSILDDEGYLTCVVDTLNKEFLGPNLRVLAASIELFAPDYLADVKFLRDTLIDDYSPDKVEWYLRDVEEILVV